ncbi:MAG: histidinol-phosphatase [Bacteroidia bacterium]|nr:histidinol-phosphatase [Bacteroidia bacterium]
MHWTNYHCHSQYSDGRFPPEDHVKTAIELEMVALGFSCHSPLPFFRPWSMKLERFAQYCSEINAFKQKYQGRIEVYLGMEMDFLPGIFDENSQLFSRKNLDYIVGSIHFVDAFDNGEPWEIDGTHELFLRGLKEIFDNDIQKAVCRYFELTRMMITRLKPNIVGHIDKIKIQSENGKLFDTNARWYQQELMATLETLASEGLILELNTRGIYKKKLPEAYPSLEALSAAWQMNIPVTLSSDSHHPGELIAQFPEAARRLQRIGYKELFVLKNKKWQPLPFDAEGIAWNSSVEV